jgi:hypothetical protein
MKKQLSILFMLIATMNSVFAQTAPPPSNQPDNKNKKQGIGLGLKGGMNFANVSNASDINSSSNTGFLFGIFLAPPSKKIISSRTELLYSKQGYNYKTNTNTGSVDLQYIVLPQLMGINITKFVQLQVGMQMAFLINASADSSKPASGSNPYAPIMDYYNRFDYGAAGGIEIYPIKNVLIGARLNISFGDLYKDPMSVEGGTGGTPPSFIPKVDVKNNVLQLYVGVRF